MKRFIHRARGEFSPRANRRRRRCPADEDRSFGAILGAPQQQRETEELCGANHAAPLKVCVCVYDNRQYKPNHGGVTVSCVTFYTSPWGRTSPEFFCDTFGLALKRPIIILLAHAASGWLVATLAVPGAGPGQVFLLACSLVLHLLALRTTVGALRGASLCYRGLTARQFCTMEARAKASSGSTALTLLDLRKASKNEAPVSDVLQKIGFYRDKWRGRRWSMAKQLKMAKTGAYRGPPPRVADVQILQTGAPWPNLAMRTQPNLPIAQLQRTRSVSPNGGRGAAAAAASSSNGASSKGKGGKTGGGKQGGGKTGGGKQGGGKQSGGGDAPPGAAGEPLSSTSTELLAQGEKFVVEADGAATEAEAVLVNSFERVAGAALIAKVGSAGKVDEVMKEWDQNKDGALSMGEWRKSLRASLGIKASNEELDRVFSSVDGDKSGSVDLSELRQLLRNMRAEAELAGTESQKLRSRAASLRSKAAKAREVAELTRAYEEMDLKLKLARESVPLASRLGEMLVRRQIKIGDLVAKWDKDGNGELSKEVGLLTKHGTRGPTQGTSISNVSRLLPLHSSAPPAAESPASASPNDSPPPSRPPLLRRLLDSLSLLASLTP